jgi:NAD(P)-dependent dehydrogenase (short-subunit alcohol dehydrogenase family)
VNTNLFDVRGRVVVVTGGLGQLGRQFSLSLMDQGANVAVFDQQATAERAQARFGSQLNNDQLLCLEVDVTEREAIKRGLEQVIGRWGPPHALINNAALDSPPNAPAAENGPFEDYPLESWERVMAVNVRGVFLCCQVIGGRMAAEGRGSIVNIASTYGLVSPDQRIYEYRRRDGAPFFKPVAYAASKSALLNLTRYLATYWAERQVRVNTLTFAGVFNNQDEEFLRRYNARVPLGRMAREDEYNGAVTFLVSDASTYMTGSNLVIDGGWTAW